MRDRRKELRPTTRLQLLSVAGGLSEQSFHDLERTLSVLYAAQPLRWQAFMDEATVFLAAMKGDPSGFADTVAPEGESP